MKVEAQLGWIGGAEGLVFGLHAELLPVESLLLLFEACRERFLGLGGLLLVLLQLFGWHEGGRFGNRLLQRLIAGFEEDLGVVGSSALTRNLFEQERIAVAVVGDNVQVGFDISRGGLD